MDYPVSMALSAKDTEQKYDAILSSTFSLQAFRMPQKIFIKRLDTQLNMWISEAKNFPAKKK